MLEDDIQYIGTRLPPPVVAPAPIRPFPSPQHPVTGKGSWMQHVILKSLTNYFSYYLACGAKWRATSLQHDLLQGADKHRNYWSQVKL